MRSLRARLLLGAGALSLLAVVGVALAARQGARVELHQFLELEAVDRRGEAVRVLAAAVAAAPGGFSAEDLPGAATRLPPGFGVLLLDERGRLLGAAGAGLDSGEVSARLESGDLVVSLARPQRERAELVLRGGGVPVPLAGRGGARGSLHLLPLPGSRGGGRTDALLGALDRRLLLVTGGVGILALLLTAALAHRLVLPLRELQLAARDLAAQRLGRRVAVRRQDEIGELAASFNRMAAELERQERLRRDLVADVAHELRAPLTALRCRIETMQDHLDVDPAATLAGLHQDVVDLSRLVDDLQELALADAGQLRIDVAPTPLPEVVASAVRAAGLDGDARLRLEVAPVAVLADPVRLRQVVGNLLANAARHTPSDGTIHVRSSVLPGEVSVEVVDSGCGLGPEQLERVFERLYRTDPSRQRETGGSGLGLAIVRSLVAAQGGRVWARSEPGRGAAFGFALPAAGSSVGP